MTKKYLAALFLFLTSTALAQNVDLISPFEDVEVREGDEFATDVLGDPWDFNERRDVGWEEGYNEDSINVENGIWSATPTPGEFSYFFPLFPGFINTLDVEPLQGDKNTPSLGITNRIDPRKYYQISYKLKSNANGHSIYWKSTSSPNQEYYWPDPQSPLIRVSNFYHHSGRSSFPSSGNFGIFHIDMSVHSIWSDTDDIYAFRMDPSLKEDSVPTEIDWLRVSDPNSAPMHTIRWQSENVSQDTLTTIWIDEDKNNFDGYPLATYTNGENPGEHTFPTSMLPPGEYYFYVTVQNIRRGVGGEIKTTPYTGKLTVNAKPEVAITSPAIDSGDDYAQTELNNPWDMNDVVDVENLNTDLWREDVWRQFTNHYFREDPNSTDSGSVFGANADGPYPGFNESDVQVHLNIPENRPVDTNKYRYLTYRMWVDSNNYGDLSDKVFRGWVNRPFTYWNDSRELSSFTAGYIKGHVIYEGWHTYTVDLWKDNILETGTLFRDYGTISNARFEPGEFDVNTNFAVDFVKLTTENQTINSEYQIDFELNDADNNSLNVDFYYDNNNSGFDGTYIGTEENLPAGKNSYIWNTEDIAPGKYYIYMVVRDGLNSSKRYSDVDLTVNNRVGNRAQARVLQDFDGDGRTDLTIYRGEFGFPGFITNKTTGGIREVPWGGATFTPIHGDFDNDGKSDYALLENAGLATHAYWYYSSDDSLHYTTFPFVGGKPAVEDYNGDGKEQIALYNPANGQWHITNGAGAPVTDIEVRSWGLPGDLSVPADFDGDGKAELAVWRPSSGHWIYLRTSDGQYVQEQWGIGQFEDIPMPGDYDGDGLADYAVFRYGSQRKATPNSRQRSFDFGSGGWYIKTSVSEAILSIWGTPGTSNEAHVPVNGDLPMLGDVNGDGTLEVMVFRSQTGQMFIDYRNGAGLQTMNLGLPGDRLPRKIR